MPISIALNDFKTALKDICRPNRFSVMFTGGFADGLFGDDDYFFVKGCSIPGESFGEIDLNWAGYKYKIAGDPAFTDVTITFWNSILKDSSGGPTLRDMFDEWLGYMSNDGTNVRTMHDEYKCSVYIQQLDGEGKVVQTYKLEFAHPKDMSEIALSMDTSDAVEEFTVVFSYSYYTVGDSPEQGGSSLSASPVGVNSSPFGSTS